MPRIRASSLAEHHDLMWSLLMDAFEHLLAQQSYESITLAAVAGQAGIARNTIYNYAVDKPTLLAAVAERAGASLAGRVEAISDSGMGPEQTISAIIVELLDSLSSGVYRNVLLQAGFASAEAAETLTSRARGPVDSIEATVSRVLASGIDAGVFRQVEDVDLSVVLAEAVIESAARRIAQDRDVRDRVIAHVNAFLLHALRA